MSGGTTADIEQNLVSFVKLLQPHVQCWKSALQESARPLRALLNQAEQLRHIERANIQMDDFEDVQKALQFYILCGIEEEIGSLKKYIGLLNKSNQDLRNKLSTLERSTLDLDWEQSTKLLRGTAVQPPLSAILQDGLEYSNFFAFSLKRISEQFKNLNVRNEQSMCELEKSFTVDLDTKCVRYFIALTQYIENENSVV